MNTKKILTVRDIEKLENTSFANALGANPAHVQMAQTETLWDCVLTGVITGVIAAKLAHEASLDQCDPGQAGDISNGVCFSINGDCHSNNGGVCPSIGNCESAFNGQCISHDGVCTNVGMCSNGGDCLHSVSVCTSLDNDNNAGAGGARFTAGVGPVALLDLIRRS